MPSKSNKRPIINDIPVQELMKIKDTTPEVRLKVRRTTSSGQWMSVIPRAIKPITDLMDGKLEEWLQSYSGGGQYIIEVWDPLTEEPAVDRFRIVLPGAPKDPKLNAAEPASPQQPNGNNVVRRWGVEIPQQALPPAGNSHAADDRPGADFSATLGRIAYLGKTIPCLTAVGDVLRPTTGGRQAPSGRKRPQRPTRRRLCSNFSRARGGRPHGERDTHGKAHLAHGET